MADSSYALYPDWIPQADIHNAQNAKKDLSTEKSKKMAALWLVALSALAIVGMGIAIGRFDLLEHALQSIIHDPIALGVAITVASIAIHFILKKTLRAVDLLAFNSKVENAIRGKDEEFEAKTWKKVLFIVLLVIAASIPLLMHVDADVNNWIHSYIIQPIQNVHGLTLALTIIGITLGWTITKNIAAYGDALFNKGSASKWIKQKTPSWLETERLKPE